VISSSIDGNMKKYVKNIREYVEKVKKYEDNMKKYMRNMKEYVGNVKERAGNLGLGNIPSLQLGFGTWENSNLSPSI